MSYALAGFVFNNFNFPPSLYSASWLPWIFRSAFKLTRGAKIFDFLGVAACTALCLFGGDIEVAGFGLLAAFGFMLLMPAEGRPKGKRFLAAILAVSVGGLMYQAQFLPSFRIDAKFHPRGRRDQAGYFGRAFDAVGTGRGWLAVISFPVRSGEGQHLERHELVLSRSGAPARILVRAVPRKKICAGCSGFLARLWSLRCLSPTRCCTSSSRSYRCLARAWSRSGWCPRLSWSFW